MRGDVLGKFGEPEIGNFGLGVVDEDVGDFEVAVDDVFFGQVEQPLEDICNEGDLESRLRKERYFDEHKAAPIIKDIFEGLLYLA